ncbi:MAG: hypothetical protein U0166_19160 [Acidobacteriota bacterium]
MAALTGLEKRTVLVYRNPTARARVEPTDAAAIVRRDSVSYEVALSRDVDRVRLSENAYPLWRAWADGVRIPLENGADASELVVTPPPGTRSLRFALVPWDLELGLAVSALAVLIALLLR